MEAMLIKSRYKITHTRFAAENYAALLAVDVEDREKREYLLNVYEGALVKPYVDHFDRLRHCPAYRGMLMDGGALAAVFEMTEGTPIDQVFFRGAEVDWRTRLAFAQQIFHLGLELSDYPAVLGCAALLSDNLLLRPQENRLAVRWQMCPMPDGMNARELALLTVDQAKKVLMRRYSSPKAEIRFLRTLDEQAFLTPAALYGHWLDHKDLITADYEKLYARNAMSRAIYLVFQNLGRWARGLWKGKRGANA